MDLLPRVWSIWSFTHHTQDGGSVTVPGGHQAIRRGPYAGIVTGALPALAASAAVAIALLRPRRVVVAGRSMEPTLLAGDRLLVGHFGRPGIGDVVALRDPNDPRRVMVKRISGLHGDQLYVTGDNPEASIDSRVFGSVPRGALLGKAVRRYAPASRSGPIR
jgi:nickel-type superoxide dismutase maturation protease